MARENMCMPLTIMALDSPVRVRRTPVISIS
jgi:hypothetical protein